jgi:hypothetical protein
MMQYTPDLPPSDATALCKDMVRSLDIEAPMLTKYTAVPEAAASALRCIKKMFEAMPEGANRARPNTTPPPGWRSPA